jgi:hypothetical protein
MFSNFDIHVYQLHALNSVSTHTLVLVMCVSALFPAPSSGTVMMAQEKAPKRVGLRQVYELKCS